MSDFEHVKQDYIRWTSHQRELVTAAFVNIVKTDLPDYRMKHCDDHVGISFIRHNIKRAQLVLNRSFHRKSFAKEQLQAFNVDVSMMIWRMQLEEEKQKMLLAGAPLDALINEIATRQQDVLLEKLLDRLEGPLMQRLMKRLDELAAARFGLIEQQMKHNPLGDSEHRKEIPSYVVIGLAPGQDQDLMETFKGECKFTFIDAGAKSRIATACDDKIVFIGKHTGHSTFETAKNVAQKATFVQSLKDMKRLIRVNINEFNALVAQLTFR